MIHVERIGSISMWVAPVRAALQLRSPDDALSPAERERADRYKVAGERDRFVAGRRLLRHALSCEVDLSVKEHDWTFETNRYGKPSVSSPLPPVEFNLSHAGRCVCVATSKNSVVGIDIEPLEQDDPCEIVWDSLTDREQRDLKNVPSAEQWDRFLSYWTAKEAVAKCIGFGVAIPFDKIDITLGASPAVEISEPNRGTHEISFLVRTINCDGRLYRLSLASFDL